MTRVLSGPGSSGSGRIGLLAVLATVTLSACTTLRGPATGDSAGDVSDIELGKAFAALDTGEVEAARGQLLRLVDGCLSAPRRRQAALLLAGSELDPSRSGARVSTAAHVSARVLVEAPSAMPDATLARSLYLLALDRGAPSELPSSHRACQAPTAPGATVPAALTPTTAERLEAMADTLAMQADSMAALRARAGDAQDRTLALEQELERIRRLLRGGLEPPRP